MIFISLWDVTNMAIQIILIGNLCLKKTYFYLNQRKVTNGIGIHKNLDETAWWYELCYEFQFGKLRHNLVYCGRSRFTRFLVSHIEQHTQSCQLIILRLQFLLAFQFGMFPSCYFNNLHKSNEYQTNGKVICKSERN